MPATKTLITIDKPEKIFTISILEEFNQRLTKLKESRYKYQGLVLKAKEDEKQIKQKKDDIIKDIESNNKLPKDTIINYLTGNNQITYVRKNNIAYDYKLLEKYVKELGLDYNNLKNPLVLHWTYNIKGE